MKLPLKNRLRLVTPCLLVLSWPVLPAGAAQRKAPSSVATPAAKAVQTALPTEIPKSVFTSIPPQNPFFPGSAIQLYNRPNTPQPPSPKPGPGTDPLSLLVCNGITPPGGAAKPTAMVNGHTFAKGETAEIKLNKDIKVRIQCEEIRAESVIILINDSKRHELWLKPDAL